MSAKSISDIAKALNLSTSTVSRAMTRPELISEKTRNKILSYIKQEGYQINLSARYLRKRCNYMVGIVVNDLCDTVIAKAASVMQEEATKRGFFPIVLSTEDSRTKERELFEQLFKSNISGLVVIPSMVTLEILDGYPKIPVVELDRSTNSQQHDEFRVDDGAAMRLATGYLHQQGCKRVAVLLGNVQRVASFKARWMALADCSSKLSCFPCSLRAVKAEELTMQAHQVAQVILMRQLLLKNRGTQDNAPIDTLQGTPKVNLIQDKNYLKLLEQAAPWVMDLENQGRFGLPELTDKSAVYKQDQNLALSKLLQSPEPFDAILAANNSIAAGVLQACYAVGIEPQKDIKLFSLDNPSWLKVLPFKIPTLTHPLERAAFKAIHRLLDRVENKYDAPAETCLLCPELVV